VPAAAIPAATTAPTRRTPPAATAAARASGALSRLADVDLAAADVATVELTYCALRLTVVAHLDEAEASRATALAICNDVR
jgi:hypothetical protein